MYTLHSYLYCIFLCADSLSCQEPKNEEEKKRWLYGFEHSACLADLSSLLISESNIKNFSY